MMSDYREVRIEIPRHVREIPKWLQRVGAGAYDGRNWRFRQIFSDPDGALDQQQHFEYVRGWAASISTTRFGPYPCA